MSANHDLTTEKASADPERERDFDLGWVHFGENKMY